jgi:hypothetical protein
MMASQRRSSDRLIPHLIVLGLALLPQWCAASDFVLLDPPLRDFGGAVSKMTADGKPTWRALLPVHAVAVAADRNGNIFVGGGRTVFKLTADGFSQVFYYPGGGVGGLAIDGSGNFITADNRTNAIYRISPDGLIISEVARLPAGRQLSDMTVAIDGSGNYIVATDQNLHVTVYRITPSGSVSTIYHANDPTGAGGVAIDGSGNIIIAKSFRKSSLNALLKIDSASTVTTIVSYQAACPECGARFVGLAIDPETGDYIVGLNFGRTVFRVTPSGAMTTLFNGSATGRAVGIVALPKH